MGVEVSLFQVILSQLKKIQRNPSLIDKWFFPDEGVRGDYDEKLSFDLGRSFHGIHFMLCRTYEPKPDDPLRDFLVFGKHKFRFKEEIGVTCAYLLPREVKDLVKTLYNIRRSRLLSNFNPEEMNRIEIYPGKDMWCPNDFDGLYDLFNRLRKYYRDAAARDSAVINIIY